MIFNYNFLQNGLQNIQSGFSRGFICINYQPFSQSQNQKKKKKSEGRVGEGEWGEQGWGVGWVGLPPKPIKLNIMSADAFLKGHSWLGTPSKDQFNLFLIMSYVPLPSVCVFVCDLWPVSDAHAVRTVLYSHTVKAKVETTS